MINRGSCPACAAILEVDQRYCVECGERVSDQALEYVASLAGGVPRQGRDRFGGLIPPVPPQMATTFAALALGFGIVAGAAISPGTESLVAGGLPPAPPVALQPPATAVPAPTTTPGATATPKPTPTPPTTPTTPSASPSIPSGTSIGSSDVGGKKKREKKQVFVSGVVVHTNPNAHSYVVASGGLRAIHAGTQPKPGAKLKVPVRRLANGTFAQAGQPKKLGRAKSATFTGTVSFSDTSVPDYTVSSRGASVLVHSPAGATPPGVGTGVTVTVQIGPPGVAGSNPSATPPPAEPAPPPGSPPPCDTDGEAAPTTPPIQPASVLTELSLVVDQVGRTSTPIEGIVQAVCSATGELVVSADDIRESLNDLVLRVPAGTKVDLTAVVPGQSVVASVGIDPTGALSLTGLASDHGKSGADDTKTAQGDLAPRRRERHRARP